jgi:cytochrome b6-f complex iron-sulfur subunit
LPALAQLAACGPLVVSDPATIDLPAPVNGLVSIPSARVPELMTPGGSLLLKPAGLDDIGRPLSFLAANAGDQGLRGYSAYCTHEGCEVAWDSKNQQVLCPCHLSRFALDGTVLHPPATGDLSTYPLKLSSDGNTITLDLSGNTPVFPAAVGNVVTFTIDQLPALDTAGGSVSGTAPGVSFPLLVLRASAAQMVAFDARCPHLGCSVRGAGALIVCPCHGSVFDLQGDVKLGPATKNLTELKVTFDGTTLAVTVS